MKICLSLGFKTVDEVRQSWEYFANRVDLVEIRLDILSELNLNSLFREKPGPVIATNRRREEGGFYQGKEEDRINILLEAAERGADYLDLEVETPETYLKKVLPSRIKDKTRIILSWHDVNGTPSLYSLKKRFHRMANYHPDLIKIVTTACSYEDNLPVLNLIPYARRQGKEIISFAMGRLGKPSRLLAGFIGSNLTYVSPAADCETAPGQLTIDEFEDIRRILR
ncbi:MAG: type I 3-dehydroquinate dehydratase [Syntrophales bacterium]|nr:type I 3-dehydroquinate dehydratase [Syntrophales bacterium]